MSDTREDLEARIAAYIDGELPPADAARLEVFLANTDPQLAEQIIGMLGDRHNLRALPKSKAPPELSARIMEQVERATLLNDIPHHEHQRPWWQSRAAIAAGFTLLIGGFCFFVAKSVIGPRDDKWNHSISESQSPTATMPAAADGRIAMAPAAPATPLPPSVTPIQEAMKGGTAETDRIASAGSTFKSGESLDKSLPNLPPPLPPEGAFNLQDKTQDKELAQAEKTEAGLQTQLARNSDVLRSNQTAAAKMGYAAVESPARALANISAGNSTLAAEPIVITLVAQDERDFARLRAALETIMSQDPATAHRQAALQTRYLNVLSNGGNYLGNSNRIGNGYDGSLTLNNSNTISNSGLINNSSNGAANGSGGAAPFGALKIDSGGAASQPAATATTIVVPATTAPASDNLDNALRYKIYSPKERDFADVPPTVTNPAAKPDAVAIAGGTVALTPPAARDQAARGLDAADDRPASQLAQKDVADEQKQVAGGKYQDQGGQNQVQNQAQNPTQNQTGTAMNGQAANSPRPANSDNLNIPFYRVALRPEQVEQLAREFHVDSITSGRQAYVITPESYNHGQAGEALAQADAASTEKAKAQSPQHSIKSDSPPAAAAKDADAAKKEMSATKADESKSSPATTPYVYHMNLSNDGPWLECIITMEPRPTPAPAEHSSK